MNTFDTSFAGRNHLGSEVTVGEINSGRVPAPTPRLNGSNGDRTFPCFDEPGMRLPTSAPYTLGKQALSAPSKRARPAYLTLVVDNGPVPAKRSHVGFGGGLVCAV